jgi:hypothetical protein
MPQVPQELLDRLIALVVQLRAESESFLEEHQDAQQWYNRGYANGMVRGLAKLLDEEQPGGLQLDDEADLAGHEVMAWGKAYRHGEAMGEKETYEIASQ